MKVTDFMIFYIDREEPTEVSPKPTKKANYRQLWVNFHRPMTNESFSDSYSASSEVTSVIEKAKTLAAKDKTGEFKLQRERDQLNTTLKNEKHHGRT
jgi:hypothetical protein